MTDALVRDVRYALRSLAHTPGFTAVAILTLALGIGVCTAVFSVVSAVLLRPLPYEDADRLVRIVENVPAAESFRGVPMRTSAMSQDDFVWWRTQTKTLSHMAVTMPESRTMMAPDGAVRLSGARVSAAWFPLYAVQPALGRWLRPDEEQPGATVIVLSTATWRRYFGSDPNVLGRTMPLDGRSYSIVGVMPPGSDDTAFWTPFYIEQSQPGVTTIVSVTSRLRDGVSLEAATAEANLLGHQLRAIPLQRGGANRFEVVRIQDQMVAAVRPALRILIVAVGVVLLIVCANVANLLLARGASRRREIAIRRALGTRRARIVCQVLTESIILSTAGGLAGVAFAGGGVRLLKSLALHGLPDRFRGALGPAALDAAVLPRIEEVTIDATVLVFVVGIAVLTGILFGIAPALRLSRVGHIHAAVHTDFPSNSDLSSRSGYRLGHVLAVSQLALATMLLVATGLLVHSFVKLSSVDIGFDPGVLTFELVLPQQYAPMQKVGLAQTVSERLRSLPTVATAGFTNRPPFSGSSWTGPVAPPDRDWERMVPEEMALIRSVSPDYLRALGVELLEGKWLENSQGGPPTVLVNRAYARRFFSNSSPVGATLRWGTVGSFQVVGVVEDIRLNLPSSPDAGPELAVFLEPRQLLPSLPDSMRQVQDNLVGGVAGTISFAVRVTGDPLAIAPDLRGVVRLADPALAVDSVTTMDRVLSGVVARPRFYAVLLAIFGAIAGCIAAIGIYGVFAYGVAQRTQELGLRMALGAQPAEVMYLVLRQAIVLVVIGIVLGLLGASGLTRYLTAMLFGLTPLDAPTYAVVALVVAAVAVLASYVPARRATRIDPLLAIRAE